MAFSLDAFQLKDKVAIVTGVGARENSIGAAYAAGLANAGASVVVADLDENGAKAVADKLSSGGAKVVGVGVDISNEDSVKAMTASAMEAFGGVDILVNNAALMVELEFGSIADVSLAEWNRVMGVNVTGALLCSQAVIPSMRSRGGGRIVNQVSLGAYPAASLYGITKLAVVGITTTLAKDLGPDNITVNAIAPGYVRSGAGLELIPDDTPAKPMLEANTPLRLRGEPDELVGALILLVSPAGAWMTGQVLHVDGGWVIRP